MATSDGGGVSREGLESAGRLLDQHSQEDRNYVELSGRLRIATHRKLHTRYRKSAWYLAPLVFVAGSIVLLGVCLHACILFHLVRKTHMYGVLVR